MVPSDWPVDRLESFFTMYETYARRTAIILLCAVLAACGSGEKTWMTESGVQITELVVGEGTGPPLRGDLVIMQYDAWYLDGKKFDSTYDRGQPFSFRMGFGRIPQGWEEGMSTMRKGGKRRLIIPPELAFGTEGRGGLVPPETWIKVEVELVDLGPGTPIPPRVSHANLEFVKTESGLIYADIAVGLGDSPKPGQSIGLRYSGFLEDGTLFDSSYIEGPPVARRFTDEAIIKGWMEGIRTMKKGGMRKLLVPPELAYGAEADPPRVPPNATLEFDIELFDFW